MEKTIHINSYTRRDGTFVREHDRIIDVIPRPEEPFPQITVPPYPNDPNVPVVMSMDSISPVLQGGVSVDVGFPDGGGTTTGEGGLGDVFGSIGGVLGTVAAVGLELAPLALEIYAGLQSEGAAVTAAKMAPTVAQTMLPAINKGVQNLTNYHKQIKTDFENSVKKLVNAKSL